MPGLVDLSGFLAPFAQKLADFIPDPAEKAKALAAAQTEMMNFVASQQAAQLDVDKAEAGSASIFVAGWRPFIGWVCGAGMAYAYVVQPFLEAALAAAYPGAKLPAIDTADMVPLLSGLLGLGAMRTYEKVSGAGKGLH